MIFIIFLKKLLYRFCQLIHRLRINAVFQNKISQPKAFLRQAIYANLAFTANNINFQAVNLVRLFKKLNMEISRPINSSSVMTTRKLILIAFFSVQFLNAFAQKKSKDTQWEKQVIRTWKLVNIDVPQYSRELFKAGIGELATITLKENGLVWMQSKAEVVIDSFFTFEKDGKRYLKMSALALQITKQSNDVMELKLDLPIGKLSSAKILFVPENEPVSSYTDMIARTWRINSGKKYGYDDSDYNYDYDRYSRYRGNVNASVIEFKPDGSFTRLQDSALGSGKWKISENVLKIDPAKGKSETYYIKSIGSRGIVLWPDQKDINSLITFSVSHETPENQLMKQQEAKKLKELEKQKKNEPTVSKVEESYIELPVESPNNYTFSAVTEKPKARPLEEMLVDTFKASGFAELHTSKAIPVESGATLILQKNNSYQLTYKTRTEKGTWKFVNRGYLILVRNGIETYIPCTIQNDYSNNQRLRSVTVTLTLPGEKDLKTITMVPPEAKK